MTDRQRFLMGTDQVRSNALLAVAQAPEGYTVTVAPPKRSLDQNAMLHALLTDIAGSGHKWAGERWTVEDWKALMVSAHNVATRDNEGNKASPLVRGLEGELVQLRESTASMTVGRASSLIEYVVSYCISNGIALKETKRQGYDEYVQRITAEREQRRRVAA